MIIGNAVFQGTKIENVLKFESSEAIPQAHIPRVLREIADAFDEQLKKEEALKSDEAESCTDTPATDCEVC